MIRHSDQKFHEHLPIIIVPSTSFFSKHLLVPRLLRQRSTPSLPSHHLFSTAGLTLTALQLRHLLNLLDERGVASPRTDIGPRRKVRHHTSQRHRRSQVRILSKTNDFLGETTTFNFFRAMVDEIYNSAPNSDSNRDLRVLLARHTRRVMGFMKWKRTVQRHRNRQRGLQVRW